MADKQPARAVARSPDSLSTKAWMAWRDASSLLGAVANIPAVKARGGKVVRTVALPLGAVRGGARTIWDIGQTGAFLTRLADPISDIALNGPKNSAALKALGTALAVGDYASRAAGHPKIVMDDTKKAAKNFQRRVDPTATPLAETFGGEMKRSFGIGLNQGELIFDGASLVYGGPALKGLQKFPRVAKVMEAAEIARASRTPRQNLRLDELYTDGDGSHYVPRSLTKDFPKRFQDNPFFVYKPLISREDFYVRHAQLDKRSHGNRLPDGGGWSAKKLGVEKFNLFDRHAFGMPAPTRGLAISNALSATNNLRSYSEGEGPR